MRAPGPLAPSNPRRQDAVQPHAEPGLFDGRLWRHAALPGTLSLGMVAVGTNVIFQPASDQPLEKLHSLYSLLPTAKGARHAVRHVEWPYRG
jgi:hypothetical protein